MGSPASPVFADLILEILEDDVIQINGFKLPFFVRYGDDILTAVREDKVNEIKFAFNRNNNHIQFTVKEERDHRISFLELCAYMKAVASKPIGMIKITGRAGI